MVPRDQFINKLRAIGYTYKKKRKKVALWRKKGGTHLVAIRNNKVLSDAYVRSTLAQCGVGEKEIEEFLHAAIA